MAKAKRNFNNLTPDESIVLHDGLADRATRQRGAVKNATLRLAAHAWLAGQEESVYEDDQTESAA